MGVQAGQTAVAGQMPGERIGTDVRTAGSSSFTAETVVQTITVALVQGRTYKIKYAGTLQSTVTGDTMRSRIREDNLTGNQLQNYRIAADVGAAAFPADVETEYTAVSSGNKTFVVTGERATGTGNVSSNHSVNGAAYLYVDYIRG